LRQVTAEALSKCQKRQPVSDVRPDPTYLDHLPDAFDFATAGAISPQLRADLKAAIESGPWPILMHGRPGNGKSSAAAIAVASHLLKHGQSSAFFWTWETLVANLLTARKRKDRSFPVKHGDDWFQRHESFVTKRLADPRCLIVLDDFAVSRLADWDFGLMFELVNCMRTGHVILTSNNSTEQMILKEIIDERIASRLSAGTIITVTGADRRAGKKVIS